MSRISILALLLAATAATAATADEAPLTLTAAMSMALGSYPSIQEKQHSVVAAGHAQDAAEWQRYPALSLDTSASAQVSGRAVTSMRVDQPVWSWGKMTSDIDAAAAKTETARAVVVETQVDVLTHVLGAYAEMNRMQDRLDAARENVEEHQRLLDLIQRRARNEINSRSEVVVAQARLAQARSEVVQFETALANARADLEQLTGQPVTAVTVANTHLAKPQNLQDVVESACTFSPTLRRLELQVKQAEADVGARKAAMLPQVGVRFERYFGAFAGTNNDSVTYVYLSQQLGGGLSSFSSVKEAEENKSAAQETIRTQKKELSDKVRTDWNQQNSAIIERPILEDQAVATREIYESSVRQFAAGRKSWMEVMNARREATQARYTLADSVWNGFGAARRLDVATGEALAEAVAFNQK